MEILREFAAVDPREERAAILERKDELLEGSADWIFESASWSNWLSDSDDAAVLWIHGDPGKGKTMIVNAAIDKLKSRVLSLAPDQTAAVAFFFCVWSDDSLNSAVALIKGLIYSLAAHQDGLSKLFLEQLEQVHLTAARRSKPSEDSQKRPGDAKSRGERAPPRIVEPESLYNTRVQRYWSILKRMLDNTPVTRIYILVDALDECAHGQQVFLESLSRFKLRSKVRWLVTSRNSPPIRKSLKHTGLGGKKLGLERNSEMVNRTIQTFIENKVRELQDRQVWPDDQLHHERLVSFLKKKAQGTFMYVSIAYRILLDRPVDLKNLEKLPVGLNHVYDRLLSQVLQPENTGYGSRKRALQTVRLARRPMTLDELCAFADIPGHENNRQVAEDLISSCAFFTIREDHTIDFIHQSAAEFLVACEDQLGDGASIHASIFAQSMLIMARELRPNLLNTSDWNQSIARTDRSQIDRAICGRLQYACVFWAQHLKAADLGSQKHKHAVSHLAAVFLRHVAVWVEAMIWLDNVSAVDEMLQALLPFADSQYITARIRDARFLAARALEYHRCPLHSYLASEIYERKHLHPSIAKLSWLKVTSLLANERALNLSYAPRGDMLALALADGTIYTIDAKSGTSIGPAINVSPLSLRTKVQFSRDGRQWTVQSEGAFHLATISTSNDELRSKITYQTFPGQLCSMSHNWEVMASVVRSARTRQQKASQFIRIQHQTSPEVFDIDSNVHQAADAELGKFRPRPRISPEGQYLVIPCQRGLSVWVIDFNRPGVDAQEKDNVQILLSVVTPSDESRHEVDSLAFDKDSKYMAFLTRGGACGLVHLPDGELVHENLDGHTKTFSKTLSNIEAVEAVTDHELKIQVGMMTHRYIIKSEPSSQQRTLFDLGVAGMSARAANMQTPLWPSLLPLLDSLRAFDYSNDQAVFQRSGSNTIKLVTIDIDAVEKADYNARKLLPSISIPEEEIRQTMQACAQFLEICQCPQSSYLQLLAQSLGLCGLSSCMDR